jgi:hypothetical protein
MTHPLTFTKGFQGTTLDIPVREGKMDELPSPLSSRPERSVVEGPAVLSISTRQSAAWAQQLAAFFIGGRSITGF